MKLNLNPIIVTGVGVSAPIPVDNRIGVNLALGVNTVVTGTANYIVQYTLDDIWAAGYTPGSGNWYTATPFITGTPATASLATTLTTGPATAVRLSTSAGTTGSVSIQVWQTSNVSA